MTTRTKRIADFIESIPESKIKSSTIHLAGNSSSKAITGTANDGCTNNSNLTCVGSLNDSCNNKDSTTCKGALNTGACDTSTVHPQNPSTDLC